MTLKGLSGVIPEDSDRSWSLSPCQGDAKNKSKFCGADIRVTLKFPEKRNDIWPG